MTIYTLSESRKLEGRGTSTQLTKLLGLANFFGVAFKSFAQISQVTLGKGQLVTHNHKTAVHMSAIHESVTTRTVKAAILNQCFKAFRLFIHNLTLATALAVHCIFGENKRAGNAESTAFLLDDGREEKEAH